jgi:hypothetical protein
LGYAFLIDSRAVSWSTKRQENVSLSTNGKWVYHGCACRERSPLTPFIYYSTLWTFSRSHHSLFWQPISDCPCKRPPVSCEDKTYRCLFPLHSLGYRRWQTPAHLLSNFRYSHKYTHQSHSISKGEAFRIRTWSTCCLRGSVGLASTTASRSAFYSRAWRLTSVTKCMVISYLPFILIFHSPLRMQASEGFFTHKLNPFLFVPLRHCAILECDDWGELHLLLPNLILYAHIDCVPVVCLPQVIYQTLCYSQVWRLSLLTTETPHLDFVSLTPRTLVAMRAY